LANYYLFAIFASFYHPSRILCNACLEEFNIFPKLRLFKKILPARASIIWCCA